MAKRIGVSRTTYTKWETGNAEPSFSCLSKIITTFNESENLDVDYNDLFSESEK